MKVNVLGSGATSPSSRRACASYLVDEKYLFDIGPGSYMNLMKAGLDQNMINAVFISHLHGDHVYDLGVFLWGMATRERKEKLLVYGPKGIAALISHVLSDANTPVSFLKFDIETVEVSAGDTIHGGSVQTAMGEHAAYDLIYRMGDFCYTGDTRPVLATATLAKGCKMLLHESSFPARLEKEAHTYWHSTSVDAARIAAMADVENLILVHISPVQEVNAAEMLEEAKENFRGRVMLASDLAEFLF